MVITLQLRGFTASMRTAQIFCSLILLLLCTPLAFADQDALTTISKISDETLFWGAFRPNLYFGVRPRIPNGLVMGLSWTTLEDTNSGLKNIRYTCEQNEIASGYGWTRYDARLGGIQEIKDHGNGIEITTSFIKDPAAGRNGGNWGVRISGKVAAQARPDIKTGIFLHLGVEQGDGLILSRGDDGQVGFMGSIPVVGQFGIVVKDRKGSLISPTITSGTQMKASEIWLSKRFLQNQIFERARKLHPQGQSPKDAPPPHVAISIDDAPVAGNLQFAQKQFEGDFEFDILFQSGSERKMTSELLSSRIRTLTETFDSRFMSTLSPQHPFDKAEYAEFSKSLLSNLVGGIGYFHGDTLVDRSYADEYEEEGDRFWEEAREAQARADVQKSGPNELFTSIPSRPFFPRGFLWDEGFHLIPIVDWDTELAMQITRSWFSLMDEDGWIGREQIMGDEARQKVPDEFQVQYPHYANPPTLFLTITSLIDKAMANSKSGELGRRLVVGDLSSIDDMATNPNRFVTTEVLKEYLAEMYPLLKKHYQWFRRTQAGDSYSYDRPTEFPKEVYRWKGRTDTHLLTSGLDDYPRSQPPHPGELHVDALSWVGLMARSLKTIARFLDEKDDEGEFVEHEKGILNNLDALHWDPESEMFCDSTVDKYGEHELACHAGYISLMPFMLGLMKPDDVRIGSVIKMLTNPAHLWTNYGIRSLSASDKFYGTGENYWRGPIWMNMNYMILTALKDVAVGKDSASGQSGKNQADAAALYTLLRKVVVQTVYKEWKRTGFAWEQYDPQTGEGRRTQHFTGWTSLVAKIVAMHDIPVAAAISSLAVPKDEL